MTSLPELLHLKKQPCNRLYSEKAPGMNDYCYNDAVPCSNEAKSRMLQSTASFKKFEFTSIFVCLLPAVRPGSARCRAPDFSHSIGNGVGFTKPLFRRRFVHCATNFLFILRYPSLFFHIPLTRCETNKGSVDRGVDKLLRLLVITSQ